MMSGDQPISPALQRIFDEAKETGSLYLSFKPTKAEFEQLIQLFQDPLVRLNNNIHINIDDWNATEIKSFLEVLLTRNDLRSLVLMGKNKIEDDSAQVIAEMLKKNSALHDLSLTYLKFSPEGVKAITEALNVNTTLVNLAGDAFSEHIQIAEILDRNRQLIRKTELKEIAENARRTGRINIIKNAMMPLKLTQYEFKKWLIPLLQDKKITGLRVPLFDFDASETLANVLRRNTTLTSLQLDFFNDIDLDKIMDALSFNKTLLLLDLSNASHMRIEIEAFARALYKNNTLISVDLGSYWFKDRDVSKKTLLEAIKHNTTLISLGKSFEKRYPEFRELLEPRRKAFEDKQRLAAVEGVFTEKDASNKLIHRRDRAGVSNLLDDIFTFAGMPSTKTKNKHEAEVDQLLEGLVGYMESYPGNSEPTIKDIMLAFIENANLRMHQMSPQVLDNLTIEHRKEIIVAIGELLENIVHLVKPADITDEYSKETGAAIQALKDSFNGLKDYDGNLPKLIDEVADTLMEERFFGLPGFDAAPQAPFSKPGGAS